MSKKYLFKDIVLKKGGFLRGPFGGDLKKEIFVKKDFNTYKVYEQGVVLNSDKNIGRYYISEEDYQVKLHKFSVQDLDFLISCSGVNMGAIFQLKLPFEKGIINQALLRIRLNNEIIDDNYFLYLFRKLICKKITKGSGDSTIPNFPGLEIIKNIEFDLPSKDIQKIVGKLFFTLDAKIELNNRINTELESLAKLIYDYWFVQFDFPNAQGKPYKSSGGKMVWNEELKREIPEGWEIGTLLDIATFTNGLACQKFRPKQNEEFYKVIKIKEMNEGFSKSSEFITKNIPEKLIVRNGDVLFSWSATLDVKIWTEGIGGLNQHIFKVTSDEFPRSYYFFELLNYLQHFIMIAKLRKTTMGHITQDHLKQSRIVIPPKDLIKKLHEIIDPILNSTIKNKEQNHQLAALRDWLLPMLMNGQVKVNDAYAQNEERLNLAAESQTQYKKKQSLNIPDNKKPFAKQVLGGKIVSIFKNDPHFTHIKFQKLQYLAEHIAEADLNWNYYRQSAGPYDPQFMHTVANKLKVSNWFEEKHHKFYPLSKTEQIEGYYQGYFGQVSQKLESLFQHLKDATEDQTEIIATLYAVWNDRIIKKEPILDDKIVEAFFLWSDRKKNYQKEEVLGLLDWMRKAGIVPVGFGYLIKEKKK